MKAPMVLRFILTLMILLVPTCAVAQSAPDSPFSDGFDTNFGEMFKKNTPAEQKKKLIPKNLNGDTKLKAKWLLEPTVDEKYLGAKAMGELIKIKSGSTFGFINRQGMFEIMPNFENINGDFKTGWLGAKSGGKWGAIDLTGKWVVQPTYEGFEPVTAQYAIAQKTLDGPIIIVDRTGNTVFRGSKKYKDLWYTAYCHMRITRVDEPQFTFETMKGEQGRIEANGKVVVKPGKFDDMFCHSEGLTWAKVGKKQFAYIDSTGEVVVGPFPLKGTEIANNDATLTMWNLSVFNEGVAPLTISVKKRSEWEYITQQIFIDRTGKQLHPLTFRDTSGYVNGIAYVRLMDNREVLVDKQGRILLELRKSKYHDDRYKRVYQRAGKSYENLQRHRNGWLIQLRDHFSKGYINLYKPTYDATEKNETTSEFGLLYIEKSM